MVKFKGRRNFWIYSVCSLTAVTLLYALNWVLKLPAITQVIGDENTWLPIVADAIISGVIFIGGNWYANADRLRTQLNDKKADFEIIRSSVERICKALNIKRKQQYFILSLDPTMVSRDLLREIIFTQQEIDDSMSDLMSKQYLVESKEDYDLFKDTCDILIKQFQIVLDGLIIVVNKWCDTLSKIEQTKLIIEMNNGKEERFNFATLYKDSCKELERQKIKFLNTYDSNLDLLNRLLDALRKNADSLLKSEQMKIKEINDKLQ